MTVRTIDVITQVQQTPVWCWAAVGAACAIFMDKKSGWTQCKMAGESIVPSPGNCCIYPMPNGNKCVQTWYLLNQNQNMGAFYTAGIANGFIQGAAGFDIIKKNVIKSF